MLSRPPSDSRSHLLGMTAVEMEQLMHELGQPRYRAGQLYSWVYNKRAASIDEMTSFNRALRETLAARVALRTLTIRD